MTSSIILFKVYDSSNFEDFQFVDLQKLKVLLLEKLEKNYFIIDKFGHEYHKDNINKIQINKSEKNQEFIMHNTTDFSSDSVYDNLTEKEIRDKILNQIKIDEILTQYLQAKKNIIEKSFSICKEIDEKSKEIKDEGNDNFEQNFPEFIKNNENFKKIHNMINQSINQINELSPKYKENIEDIEKMYNETINEIDNNINNKYEGKPHYNTDDIKELKNTLNSYNCFIREKISRIINNQQLTYNLESKINELLIYAEKINFYVNLNQIPKMYEICRPQFNEELKRRSYFKYIYDNIIEFLNSNFIMKEYELRKKFFEKNFKFSEKTRVEKKTIDILNKLLDIEQEKIDEELKNKISDNDLNDLGSKLMLDDDNDKEKIKYEFDEDILKSINDIKIELEETMDTLYSKNKLKKIKDKYNNDSELNKPLNIFDEKIKNDINNQFEIDIEEIKSNLKSFSVPELGQKKIMDIIENKIFKNMSNSENKNNVKNEKGSEKNFKNAPSFNDMTGSDLFMSGYISTFNKSDEGNFQEKIYNMAQLITNRYSNFLWFYNKLFDYLFVFIQQTKNNYGIEIRKEEPLSINNLLVEILNENLRLKEKIKNIKEAMKNFC